MKLFRLGIKGIASLCHNRDLLQCMTRTWNTFLLETSVPLWENIDTVCSIFQYILLGKINVAENEMEGLLDAIWTASV